MIYLCDRCGKLFDQPDIVTEPHGEKVGVCPHCHGHFEIMHQCKICGEYFTEDDLTDGVCDACIYNDATVERCIRYGADCEESVAINGFIASVLSADKINEILANEIMKANDIIPIDCSGFVDDDKSWWAEQLLKEETL
jgi:DNA-directed RNA polymerase subunit RPC12/RpoP